MIRYVVQSKSATTKRRLIRIRGTPTPAQAKSAEKRRRRKPLTRRQRDEKAQRMLDLFHWTGE